MSSTPPASLAIHRLERFVRHINRHQLAQLPISLLMWRDDSFIAAVDVSLPADRAREIEADRAKDAQASAIARTLRDSGATAYAIFMEAWAARPIDPRNPFAGPSPSQRPDRYEVIFAAYETCDGFTLARQYTIGRDADGRIRLEHFFETTRFEGRFSGLLKRPDPARN